MNKGNWVCFDCRTTKRRSCWGWTTWFQPWVVGSIGDGSVECPDCKKPSRYLGHRIGVPPKRDIIAWKKLREYVNERRQSHLVDRAKQRTLRKHGIERRIAELQERPLNKERAGLIKKLREELEALANAKS